MRRQCLLWLLMLSLVLGGCWDRKEVNDLGIITVVGLDQAEEGLTLTLRVVAPSRSRPSSEGQSGTEAGRSSVVYSATGRTIMDAAKQIQLRSSRWLFWGHSRALVVGQTLARSGVGPVLDFWGRHREPRQTMQIAVAADSARDLLTREPRLERLLSEALRETLNLRLQARVNLNQFGIALSQPGQEPIAPIISAEPGIVGGYDVRILGTALFKGDRMVGSLDRIETRGLLWLRNEATSGVITVTLPDQGPVSITITQGATELQPQMTGNKLRMDISVLARGDVSETSYAVDLEDPAVVRMVELSAGAALRERVQTAISLAQKEMETDVIGFGDAVRRHDLHLWETRLKDRWDSVFPEIATNVRAVVLIERVGGHGRSPGLTPAQGR